MKKKRNILLLMLLFPLVAYCQLADSTSRVVRMEGTVNFRDVGGYKTKEGKEVITGKVFRSASINQLTDNDMKKMADLNIYTVIDFRGTKESESAPDRLLEGTDYTLCPAGSDNLPSAQDLAALLKDGDFLMTMYSRPSIGYYGERYKPLFQKLLVLPSDQAGLLYHCTGGRDRTGMATALFLYILDVPMETIEADFVASNIYLKPMNKKMYQQIGQATGMSDTEIEEKMKLRPELIQSFFKTITDEYGSIENFMEKELGVGSEEITLLKQKYTK